MPTPREVLTRRERGGAQSENVPVLPALPAREAPPERVVVPRPVRTDSVYRRLMISHDRARTRHI